MRVVNWLDFIRNYKGMCWLGARSVYDSNGLLIAANTGTRHTQPALLDPGFDDTTKWTKGGGWSVANSLATQAGGNATGILQTVATAGCRYQISYIISRLDAGGVYANFGSLKTSAGTYTDNGTCSNTSVGFSCNATFVGDISIINSLQNISLSSAPPIIREGAWNNTNFIQATAANMMWDADSGTVSAPGRHIFRGVKGDRLDITPLYPITDDWTIYLVVNPTAVSGDNWVLFGTDSSTLACLYQSSAGKLVLNSTTNELITTTDSFPLAKTIITVAKKGTVGSIRINNGTVKNGTCTAMPISIFSLADRITTPYGAAGDYHAVTIMPKNILGSRIDKLILHGLAHETGVTL